MSCQFDEFVIGERVIIYDFIECTTCWSKVYGSVKGTYKGHFQYPSGLKALVIFDSPVVCPGCGETMNGGTKDCDDSGLTETLFVKIREEISA